MSIQALIEREMGSFFMEFPSNFIADAFAHITNQIPLIFVLQTGKDPSKDLMNFAQENDQARDFVIKGLGQGQGESSLRAIEVAKERGSWVFLQNCHLAGSFMSQLAQEVANLDSDTHADFRLFLSTRPTAKFPISLLL